VCPTTVSLTSLVWQKLGGDSVTNKACEVYRNLEGAGCNRVGFVSCSETHTQTMITVCVSICATSMCD